jgi:hypothetical protein
MAWNIDFTNLIATHPSGLKVEIVRDSRKQILFQPVQGTEQHLENIPNGRLCIAELGAAFARFLERRH